MNRPTLVIVKEHEGNMEKDTQLEGMRDGYYILAIAILRNCSLEKAQALYEGRTIWVTPEIIQEMIELNKKFKISEIAEMYCMDPHQVRFYLKRAGAFVPTRKKRDTSATSNSDDLDDIDDVDSDDESFEDTEDIAYPDKPI